MAADIKRNYIYNVFYQVISIIVPFITAPYTSRVLGVEAIGAYSYTAANVSYFSILAGLGLAAFGKREIAYCQNDSKRRSIVFFEVQLYKLLTTCMAVIAFFIFVRCYSSDDIKGLYQIQVVSILSVFFDVSWFFQGLEDFKITVLRSLFVKVIGTICVFAFVHKPEDIEIHVILHCMISIVSNIMLWPYLVKYIKRPNTKDIHPLRITVPMLELFIPVIAIQIYNVLDKTMVGGVTRSSYESGYYEQTTRIVNVILTLVTSLGGVLLPRMAAIYTKEDMRRFQELALKAFRFVILCAAPLCAGVIAVADRFIPLFLGPGYDKVVVILRIYALVIIVIPISNIAGDAVLTPTGQHNKGTVAVVAGAVVSFISNMFLIPRLQAVGAAISSLAAELVVTALHVYFIRNQVNIKQIAGYFFRNILLAFVMGIAVFAVGFISQYFGLPKVIVLAIQIIAGIIIYYCLLTFIVKDKLFVELKNLATRKAIEMKNKIVK